MASREGTLQREGDRRNKQTLDAPMAAHEASPSVPV
jgi:hypothetical protein